MQGAGEITPPGKSAGLPETVQLPLEEDFSTPLGPFKRLATEEEVRQWQHSNSSFIEGPTPYKTLQEIPVVEFDGAPPIDQILEKGSRVLWIKKDNSSLLIGPKDAKQLKSEWQSD
ncbi:MAG: hypothetical protein Q7S68_04795, partial [Deltaproteobacteria bacterium]|nr:hypothetical protein [Deltaproteobacteria bacterium]